MERAEAIQHLSNEDINKRYQAAKWFLEKYTDQDYDLINLALKQETVSWIRYTLANVLKKDEGEDNNPQEKDEGIFNEVEKKLMDQIYNNATYEVVTTLVHEIRPILGRIENKVIDLEDNARSKLIPEIEKLKMFLSSITLLASSASSPKFEEFNLGELISTIVLIETENKTGIQVTLAGKNPALIVSDKNLIELVFSNGLRNAIEATSQSKANNIVINWGETDIDNWIVILDTGIGLPKGIHNLKKIGHTSKKGHLGMGLAIAQRGVTSLEGSLTLTPRDEGGTSFQFRWKKVV